MLIIGEGKPVIFGEVVVLGTSPGMCGNELLGRRLRSSLSHCLVALVILLAQLA